MTSPVSQEAAGEKIKMTSPVGQQRSQNKWTVSFMMPGKNTMATLPEPNNPKVKLRQIPANSCSYNYLLLIILDLFETVKMV